MNKIILHFRSLYPQQVMVNSSKQKKIELQKYIAQVKL